MTERLVLAGCTLVVATVVTPVAAAGGGRGMPIALGLVWCWAQVVTWLQRRGGRGTSGDH